MKTGDSQAKGGPETPESDRARGVIFGLMLLVMGTIVVLAGGLFLAGRTLAVGVAVMLGIGLMVVAGLVISGRMPWLSSFLQRNAGGIPMGPGA